MIELRRAEILEININLDEYNTRKLQVSIDRDNIKNNESSVSVDKRSDN